MAGENVVADLLNQWQAGGLDLILVFLLVFALVFGILQKINLFKDNKAVNVIIALVIGLMSLQWGYLVSFTSQLLPRFAIALLVLLAFAIAMLAFANDEGHKKNVMLGLWVAGGVFVLIAVINAFSDPSIAWFGTTWWQDNGGLMIGAILLIGVIIALAVSGKSS